MEIASVKVLWRNKDVEEATWLKKNDTKHMYPHIFILSKVNILENNLFVIKSH